MRAVRVIWYMMLGQFRDKSGVISMIVFPIIFMTILGLALSSAFKNEAELSPIKVVYVDNGSEGTRDIFKRLIDEGGKNKITFSKLSSIGEGKDRVKKDGGIVLVEIKEKEIDVYKNEQETISVNVVLQMLKTISDRYSVYGQIIKVSPQGVNKINNDFSKDYTVLSKINIGRSMSSFDYYGIVEITMMLLYGAQFAFYSVHLGRKKRVENRILSAGILRVEYMMYLLISSFVVVSITMVPAFLYSFFILKTYWGTSPWSILAILASLNFFATSLGVCLGWLFKEEKTGQILMTTIIIPILTFLGGGYMYFDENVNNIFNLVTKISPMRWVNRSIINIIYSSDYSKFNYTLTINLVLGLMFLMLALIVRKEEA